MKLSRLILATILGAVALFVSDSAFQAIPNFGIRAVEQLETKEFTTESFSLLTNRMAYIVTDNTVSFVATQPANFYQLSKFFTVESLSVLAICLIFAIVFSKLGTTALRNRILITFSFALIASLAIHIPYFNWWGFSLLYTVGVILKTVLGWVVVSYVQNSIVYKVK
jgi:hypothetical protein